MNALLLATVLIAAPAHPRPADADTPRMQVIFNAIDERIANQTDLWFEKGEFPRCVQVLKVQYSFSPSDYETATNLGWMLENIEQWDQALAVYIDFRKNNPNDPEAPYPEAWFYYQRKAYSKVPPLLEPTIKMNRKPHANTYRTLAQAYERLGLLADAKRVYTLLLDRIPGDPATQNNLRRIERKISEGSTGGGKRPG